MRFIASIIYHILKSIVFIILRIYYSRFTVIHKERLNFKNPAIVVSNHPSTLMDPFNTAINVSKQIAFLANAGLFKNPIIAAILNLYCIPIERPKDVNGRRIQNEENFARADRHLAQKRCIYIAPEGTSVVERRLRKVKTGAARIALSAESKNDFKLGITIIPVGLNYTTPLYFQGEALVNIGEPIKASDYKEVFNKDPFHAVKEMTQDLQKSMESLIFHTKNDETDQLLRYIETVLKSEKPLDPKATFTRTQKILNQIKTFDESVIQTLKQTGDKYFELIKKEATNDLAVYKNIVSKSQSSFWDFLKISLGLPFFLYGWINNFIAFFIPKFLAQKINIYHGYRPAVLTVAGLIFLPIIFFLQTKLLIHYFPIPNLGWIYLLSLLPFGWLAWQYRNFVLQYLKNLKVKRLRSSSSNTFEQLKTKRADFLTQLNLHKGLA